MTLHELKNLIIQKLPIVDLHAESLCDAVRFHWSTSTYRVTTDLRVEKVTNVGKLIDDDTRRLEKLLKGECMPSVGVECEVMFKKRRSA